MSDHQEHQLPTGRNLVISILMNIIITLSEIVGGIISGSLALLADAFHNATDTLAGVLALWTLRLGRRAHDEQYTFGYRRAEILSGPWSSLRLSCSERLTIGSCIRSPSKVASC
jgi:cobalt-zinc-cadmium efflux system protein